MMNLLRLFLKNPLTAFSSKGLSVDPDSPLCGTVESVTLYTAHGKVTSTACEPIEGEARIHHIQFGAEAHPKEG